MWSIPPLDRGQADLDVTRPTKSQDARLDSRDGQQDGRRRRRKRPTVEDGIEVDTFEPGSEEDNEA